MTRILGIESSCDETAAAVVDDRHHVRSSVIASQVDVHRAFGTENSQCCRLSAADALARWSPSGRERSE